MPSASRLVLHTAHTCLAQHTCNYYNAHLETLIFNLQKIYKIWLKNEHVMMIQLISMCKKADHLRAKLTITLVVGSIFPQWQSLGFRWQGLYKPYLEIINKTLSIQISMLDRTLLQYQCNQNKNRALSNSTKEKFRILEQTTGDLVVAVCY